jgi:ketosteroid isomerase-like protein
MLPDPESVVRDFLAALAERDTARAGARLAPDAHIVFPGGAIRRSIDDIVAGSQRKYRQVAKAIERIDVLPTGDDAAIVYCYGTLYGAWADGQPFSGIRFIDRFELRAGLIVEQQVWNDSAFVRPPA